MMKRLLGALWIILILISSPSTARAAHGVTLTEKVWIVTLNAFPPARVRASFDNKAHGWHAQAEWDPAQPGPLAQAVRLRDGHADNSDWVVSLWMEPIVGAAGGTSQPGYHLVLAPDSRPLSAGKAGLTPAFVNLADPSEPRSAAASAIVGGAPRAKQDKGAPRAEQSGGAKSAYQVTATWERDYDHPRRLAVVPSAPGGERSLDPLSGIAQELATVLAEVALDRAKAGAAELLRSQLEQALCRDLVWNAPLRSALAGAPATTCSADEASCNQPLFPKTCEAVKHLRLVDLAASAKGLGEAFLGDALALGWGQMEQVLVRQVLKQDSVRAALAPAFAGAATSLPESKVRDNIEALSKALQPGSASRFDTALGLVLSDRVKLVAVVKALDECARSKATEKELQTAASSLFNALADLSDEPATSKILRRLGNTLRLETPYYGNVSNDLGELAAVLGKANDETSKRLGEALKKIAQDLWKQSEGERATKPEWKGLATQTLAAANVIIAMTQARTQLDATAKLLELGDMKSPLEMFFSVILLVPDYKAKLKAAVKKNLTNAARIPELKARLEELVKLIDEGTASRVVSGFGRVGAVAHDAASVLREATSLTLEIASKPDGLAGLLSNRAWVVDLIERVARLMTDTSQHSIDAQKALRALGLRFSQMPDIPTPENIAALVQDISAVAQQFPATKPALDELAVALKSSPPSRPLKFGALVGFDLQFSLAPFTSVVAGKSSFLAAATELGVDSQVAVVLDRMSIHLPTIQRILPIVTGTLLGRVVPDRAAQLVLSELASESWAEHMCADNTDTSRACVSACGADAVFAALEVCTSRSSGCTPADVTEVLTSTILQGEGACQAVVFDLKARYPDAEPLILAGLEVLHPRPGTTPKAIARDVTTVAFALVRPGVCDGNDAVVACKDFDGTRDLTLAIFDDRPDLAIVAGAGVIERALDRMGEENEDKKKALGKVSKVVGAVSAYAVTYATGTKSDAATVNEQHEARRKAIEGLIDATTDRHGRGGDSVFSLGINPGLFGGLQLGARQTLNLGVPPQLSLPAGFAVDLLPSPKAGRSVSCGGHFQLSFVDLGQFLAYASVTNGTTSNTEVAKPTWANAFLVGGQAGVLIGSPTNAVNLSLDIRYAPSLFSTSTDGTSGGAFRLGLTASYYVPLFDFN